VTESGGTHSRSQVFYSWILTIVEVALGVSHQSGIAHNHRTVTEGHVRALDHVGGIITQGRDLVQGKEIIQQAFEVVLDQGLVLHRVVKSARMIGIKGAIGV